MPGLSPVGYLVRSSWEKSPIHQRNASPFTASELLNAVIDARFPADARVLDFSVSGAIPQHFVEEMRVLLHFQDRRINLVRRDASMPRAQLGEIDITPVGRRSPHAAVLVVEDSHREDVAELMRSKRLDLLVEGDKVYVPSGQKEQAMRGSLLRLPRIFQGGSFSYLIAREGRLVKVSAAQSEDGTQFLRNQIGILDYFYEQLAPEDARHFPKAQNASTSEEIVSYEMDVYGPGYRTVMDLLLNGQIGAVETINILDAVLGFLMGKVYRLGEKPTPLDFHQKTHFRKIERRLQEVFARSPILTSLQESTRVRINGRDYFNLPTIVEMVKSQTDGLRTLLPPRVHAIHGDPHFDDILVDIDGEGRLRDFVLLDPKNFLVLGGGDCAYDFAKWWHNFEGGYDFIYTGCFDFDYNPAEGIRLKGRPHAAQTEYQRVGAQIFPIFDRHRALQEEDPFWFARTMFTQAALFSSVSLFHLKRNYAAEAFYTLGTIFMNEFYDLFAQRGANLRESYRGRVPWYTQFT